MIEVFINHTPITLPPHTTLAQALQLISAQPPFAVAVNLQFIPRSAYDAIYLKAGDAIEVVQPITGG